MKKIIIYEAEDGTRFKTRMDCVFYEAIIKNIEEIMSTLNSYEDGKFLEFRQGDVYVQQNLKTVKQTKSRLLNYLYEIYPSYRHYAMHQIYYILSDANDGILKYFFYSLKRFDNIDKHGKEWGQYWLCVDSNNRKKKK